MAIKIEDIQRSGKSINIPATPEMFADFTHLRKRFKDAGKDFNKAVRANLVTFMSEAGKALDSQTKSKPKPNAHITLNNGRGE